MALVLDRGAVTKLSRRTSQNAAILRELRRRGSWPPVVPTAVLVECLSGRPGPDANVNHLLKACDLLDRLPATTARRAAELRARARRGSGIDAIVVALAEPAGEVLTGDLADIGALASRADDVLVHRI